MREPSEGAPLAGVRVVDFGQYIAGPLAAMILADLGADVVRVDPPSGPSWDHPATNILNRNKQSIALDLNVSAELEIARRLIGTADVVIENFRPGVMERFGLGANAMTTAFPPLIYLSLPGFASSDIEARDIPAWEAIVAAAVGQLTDMGLNRVLMGKNVSFSPLPLASAYGAVLGAMAAVLALYSRSRNGRGDIVEVPLAAALSEGLAYNSMNVKGVPSRYLSHRQREIARRRQTGEPLEATYDELQSYLEAFLRTYTCADGRHLHVVASGHANHPERLLSLLGLLDEVVADGLPTFDPYLPTRRWPTGGESNLRGQLSSAWNKSLAARMAEAFARESSSHWERLLGQGKVASAAVRTTQEWLQEDHPVAGGLLLEVEDRRYGRMRQPSNVAWLGGVAAQRPSARPASLLDGDRQRILDELREAEGRQSQQLLGASKEAANECGWLDGITVLDLTNVIAGPTIAGTLGRFGAKVIRLEPVRPTFGPWAVLIGMQSNRGKRSALVDIRTGSGRKILEDLIKRSDVVTINATEQQLADLRLNAESIAALNPNAVLCQLDAWGGPTGGPWRNRIGYDDVVQAATGVMARFGGGVDTPEEHAHFGTIDVLAGYAGALAAAVALYARGRGIETRVARASLAAAGQFIQLPFMYDHTNRPPFNEPSGVLSRGYGPLYRWYAAADGFFFLACRTTDVPAMIRELGIEGPTCDARLEQALEQVFANKTVDLVVRRLRELGVGAHRLERLEGVRARFMAAGDGGSGSADTTLLFERHVNHPSGYAVELIGSCAVRSARAVIAAPTPTPKPGADTRAILTELGYAEGAIKAMFDAGEVAKSWSEEYLPS